MKRKQIDHKRFYQGEEKNGKREGYGILIVCEGYHKGDRYEGEWEDGEYNGRGIYDWADGSTYEGEFRDHKRHR